MYRSQIILRMYPLWKTSREKSETGKAKGGNVRFLKHTWKTLALSKSQRCFVFVFEKNVCK